MCDECSLSTAECFEYILCAECFVCSLCAEWLGHTVCAVGGLFAACLLSVLECSLCVVCSLSAAEHFGCSRTLRAEGVDADSDSGDVGDKYW